MLFQAMGGGNHKQKNTKKIKIKNKKSEIECWSLHMLEKKYHKVIVHFTIYYKSNNFLQESNKMFTSFLMKLDSI